MTVYEFHLILKSPELSDDECERLYKAGCDDATIVTRNGVTHLAFDREAESLESAIRSATANVRDTGFEVVRVEMDALV